MPDRYGTFGSYLSDALGDARVFARQQATDSALKAYAANPQDQSAYARLLAADPGTALQVGQLQIQRQKLVAEGDARNRDQQGRELFANYVGGATRGPTSIASVNPAKAAPAPTPQAGAVPVVGDDIVVTAKSEAPAPSIADIARVSPELAQQAVKLRESMASLDKAGRDALTDKAATFALIGAGITPNMTAQQRIDYIDGHRETLRAHGITDQEIDAFDPTDANIAAQMNLAQGVKEYGASQDRAASRALTERGQNLSAATARRGQDIGATNAAAGRAVTMRGQNMVDARARQALSGQGGKLTEAQSKATGYYGRATQANEVLEHSTVLPGAGAQFADNLPFGVGAGFNNGAVQQNLNARRAFVQAVLRQDSGAAINKEEFNEAAKAYFPVPGDTPGTISQKNALRRRAIEGLRISAGSGADRIDALPRASGGPRITRIKGDAEYAALPSGAVFVGPDGKRRTKP